MGASKVADSACSASINIHANPAWPNAYVDTITVHMGASEAVDSNACPASVDVHSAWPDAYVDTRSININSVAAHIHTNVAITKAAQQRLQQHKDSQYFIRCPYTRTWLDWVQASFMPCCGAND
jgi:hypothetical protein